MMVTERALRSWLQRPCAAVCFPRLTASRTCPFHSQLISWRCIASAGTMAHRQMGFQSFTTQIGRFFQVTRLVQHSLSASPQIGLHSVGTPLQSTPCVRAHHQALCPATAVLSGTSHAFSISYCAVCWCCTCACCQPVGHNQHASNPSQKDDAERGLVLIWPSSRHLTLYPDRKHNE